MKRSVKEISQVARFETDYEAARSPIIQTITNNVCGCGYLGSSWTTRSEAEEILKHLELDRSDNLLDVGAGAGWPGLYLTNQSGCKLTLLDLPVAGLRIARERADTDGISNRVQTIVGDGTNLPFPSHHFSAVSHSDVLCCLPRKLDVLNECRRVIKGNGCMVFTVISIVPGLSHVDFKKALMFSPGFVESDSDYHSMLLSAGWSIIRCRDITKEFKESCERMIKAESEQEPGLRRLIGNKEFEEGSAIWKGKLSAIKKRLLRRELFVVKPS